jgi:hypothetical protein
MQEQDHGHSHSHGHHRRINKAATTKAFGAAHITPSTVDPLIILRRMSR